MKVWVLKGPGLEMFERLAEARRHTQAETEIAYGNNTFAEANDILARDDGDAIYVVTSSYHVPRAYLTLAAATLQHLSRPHKQVLHVWGVGTVTNEQAQREARKLAEAQARGHALKWEDVA